MRDVPNRPGLPVCQVLRPATSNSSLTLPSVMAAGATTTTTEPVPGVVLTGSPATRIKPGNHRLTVASMLNRRAGPMWSELAWSPLAGHAWHEPGRAAVGRDARRGQKSFGRPGTGTSSTNVSAPRKSSGLAVYSGRALLAAVAAIIRSEARVRGWRPMARTAAHICP
jgi:hypothetical protein